MRDYALELENRVKFIKDLLEKSGAKGIVYGNSGGKDSALVGILCKKACENTKALIMPCSSNQNYGSDMEDAKAVCQKFDIEYKIIDLTKSKEELLVNFPEELNKISLNNIAPRLRMTSLYIVSANETLLVAGTGNKSEIHMGYFTKWGDAACDFNVISDLTVTEVFEFLKFLECPESIVNKAPSAGLFDGQTDEQEMGIEYKIIDKYLNGEHIMQDKEAIIRKFHNKSLHKRDGTYKYKG